LAHRYGWGYKDIAEGMYWEDVYETYEYASNCNVLEKNEEMKFNFLLHAGSKDAMNSWRDLLIPFPDRNWKPQKHKQVMLPPKFNDKKTSSNMSDEQRERLEYVKKRLKEQSAKQLY
jgi:hypothetical protein